MPNNIGNEVRVFFYGNLIRYRRNINEQYRNLEIQEGWSILDIIRELGITEKDITFLQCNGERVTPEHCLSPGDEIKMFNVMSGG